MSESFVPFQSPGHPNGSPNAAPFRVLVVPGASDPASLSGTGSPACGSAGHALSGAGGIAPKVAVEREGDRVTRIRVTCVCGSVIELDCVY